MKVIGIAGFSGSGKTTLIERLIPVLKEEGLSVAVIKHDGRDHIDPIGKDTDRFMAAGARSVSIASASKSVRINDGEKSLQKMINEIAGVDLILVEGYKYEMIPRIGITSVRTGYRLAEDISVYQAVVTDAPERYADGDTTVFEINDIPGIARWMMEQMENGLTHFDAEGNARMVSVGDKSVTKRTARAGASVLLNRQTYELIRTGGVKKGDVLTTAQIAGIMGAKRTPELIPMCHPLLLDGVDLKLRLNEEKCAVDITSEVKCTGRTGVEMEAITAVSVAAMTVYDMCKAVQRDITITDIRLLSKTGGIHGDYQYEEKFDSKRSNFSLAEVPHVDTCGMQGDRNENIQ